MHVFLSFLYPNILTVYTGAGHLNYMGYRTYFGGKKKTCKRVNGMLIICLFLALLVIKEHTFIFNNTKMY